MHGLLRPPGFRDTAALLADPDMALIETKATQARLDECPNPCANDPDAACLCWVAPDDRRPMMPKLQPAVRALLIVIGAAVAGLTAIQDQLPEWVQGVIVALSAVSVGAGVIPPQVPARTTVRRKPGEDGYGVVDAILIVFLVAVVLIVIFHFA